MPSPETFVPAPRRSVLERLRAAEEPLDAAGVAALLDIHITTARFHLDQLVADGLVERRPAREKRRGRPRNLYAARPGPGDARDQLIRVLAAALERQQDSEARATAAGRGWAEELPPLDEADSLGSLVDRLGDFGFEPEPAPGEIRLRGCPFREAARAHPGVVCAAHAGLVEALLDRSRLRGRLHPLVDAELCLVTATVKDEAVST